MVVIKDSWPPTSAKNVETIAASFVPPKTGSAVRLFNLAADVPRASLKDGAGATLASGVSYNLGSSWAPVSSSQQTYSVFSDTSAASLNASRSADEAEEEEEEDGALPLAAALAAPLASAPFTPPAAPQVFTTFLLGSKSFGYSLLPQVDAPETGPCKPP